MPDSHFDLIHYTLVKIAFIPIIFRQFWCFRTFTSAFSELYNTIGSPEYFQRISGHSPPFSICAIHILSRLDHMTIIWSLEDLSSLQCNIKQVPPKFFELKQIAIFYSDLSESSCNSHINGHFFSVLHSVYMLALQYCTKIMHMPKG